MYCKSGQSKEEQLGWLEPPGFSCNEHYNTPFTAQLNLNSSTSKQALAWQATVTFAKIDGLSATNIFYEYGRQFGKKCDY